MPVKSPRGRRVDGYAPELESPINGYMLAVAEAANNFLACLTLTGKAENAGYFASTQELYGEELANFLADIANRTAQILTDFKQDKLGENQKESIERKDKVTLRLLHNMCQDLSSKENLDGERQRLQDTAFAVTEAVNQKKHLMAEGAELPSNLTSRIICTYEQINDICREGIALPEAGVPAGARGAGQLQL